MRRDALVLSLSTCLFGLLLPATEAAAQVVRVEAESGSLNGFSVVENGQFSGGARINGDVSNPSATYMFTGWDGVYDVSVGYCDEDDGVSSYQLAGSAAGSIASWDGDVMTGSNTCGGGGLIVREVASSIVLEEGETITFTCVRDPLEPCRTDYFDFTYVPPEPPPSSQPAFPGALGFGADTTGARGLGAEVCVVASLADSGPGSFRACAEQGPPAYITFAVSGYVDLSDEVDIASNKTIECATAPGDGVVFRKSRLHVTGDNVILRSCRAWPGNEPGGQPLGVRDGIVVGKAAGSVVRNVIVANSSMMFATDENAGTWHPVERVTFQNNIVAWGLVDAGHPEGDHSMGMLISENPSEVSLVRNYFAFNCHRNPVTKSFGEPVEVLNNLDYCYGENAVHAGHSQVVHVVGNRFKGGCAPHGECGGSTVLEVKLRDDSFAYVADNTMSDGSPATIDPDSTSDVSSIPLFSSGVIPIASSSVEYQIMSSAGPAQLLALEVDALGHYATDTGAFISSMDEVGGWPTLQGGTNPPDSDGDGMPDWWEAAHCSASCAPTGDHDGDGYENIEEWFHSFYQRRVPVGLEVDFLPLGSDGNEVFEPGEEVGVAPAWRNDGEFAVALTGVATHFHGPGAPGLYIPLIGDASYGTLSPGATASCQGTGDCYRLGLASGGGRPASHWDASFDEELSEATRKSWDLHIGDSFTDVVRTDTFYPAVESMLHHGISSGCGGSLYCPAAAVTRGETPVFLLKAKEGPNYQPSACVAGDELFVDVPAGDPLCPWIEELANRGVVGACNWVGDYCPSSSVARAQMAVFLLRTLEGGGYMPPGCSGVFADVPCPSAYANWIEDVYARGIADGCGIAPLEYCPFDAVNRGQMAVFVGNTFGLTLYGP